MLDQLWILGVALVTLGSIGNNTGSNLVSFDHKRKEEQDEKDKLTQTDLETAAAKVKLNDFDCDNPLRCTTDLTNTRISLNISTSSGFSEGLVVSDTESPIADDSLISDTSIEASESLVKPSTNEITNVTFSSMKSSTADTVKKKGACCSLRTVGVTIFVVGNLMTFAAFGFAAQSLLAALESIQFVSNVAFAKYLHKEIITSRMIIATVGIILGNILVVIFANHSTELFDSNAILHLYKTNNAYHGYLVVAFLLWLNQHLIFLKYYNARINEKRLLWKHSFIEPFTFSVSSSIIGTQAVLQAKCMSMLIQVTARGEKNEFTYPTIWVLLFAWIFFVVFWLRRLDLGLKLFPPLFIIPVLQVFFIFFAILCGGIFFEEFSQFTPGQYVGFVFGVLLILSGVYGLAPVTTDPTMIKKTDDGEADISRISVHSNHGLVDEVIASGSSLPVRTLTSSSKPTSLRNIYRGDHETDDSIDIYGNRTPLLGASKQRGSRTNSILDMRNSLDILHNANKSV